MKKELIELLRCPNCSNNKYKCDVLKENELEIREGTIECEKCGLKIKIMGGIIDLLFNSSSEIEKERMGTVKFFKENPQSKERILDLPDVNSPNTANFYFVLDNLDLQGNELVLDAGAGFGWAAKEFAKRGCQSIAVDISEEALAFSEFYIEQGIYIDRVLAHMEALPFKNSIFDIVCINAALHHSSNLNAAVKELARVLKKDGRLVVVNEPVGGLIPKKDYALDAREAHDQNDHLYSVFAYKKACLVNGLDPVVYFPPSIDQILKQRSSYIHKVTGEPESINSKMKGIFSRLIGYFWDIEPFRRFFIRYLFYPSMIIAGLTLVLIAEKKQ
ncbi:MAG: class I SAM-dependent methyltransferase [Candidatus Omnitrophica bacterium]|nr:class I SAM-dependent methyltransferase [Candidatus Omnitrophota bacterium]